MKKRFFPCVIALLLVIACISGLTVNVVAEGNTPEVTLNYSIKDVDVGRSFYLTATVESQGTGTVTWSSSSATVASVNASGFVTGKSAGTAIITATYTDDSGASSSASCRVHVTVEDGLYYIKNASSELCMYTAGSAVSIQTQETDADSRLGQLWYIEYHSDYGRYAIRPIRDFSLAMSADEANYVTVVENEIGAYWDIVENGFGYAIRYYGNSSENAKPVVAAMPGSQIYLGSWQTSLTCHWELEKACGIFLRDIETQKIVDDTTEIPVSLGETATLFDLGLNWEYYGSLNGGMTWSPGDANVATVNYEGTVTCVGGDITETTSITVTGYLNGVSYTESFKIFVVYPRSGYELDYEPELWNNVYVNAGRTISKYTNCYAYILNNQIDPYGNNFGCNSTYDPYFGTHKQQPGEFYNANRGAADMINWSIDDPQSIIDAVKKDFEMYNSIFGTSLQFYQVSDPFAPCPEGSYKVALVINEAGNDYHWYRLDSNGSWSHKQGESDVEQLDGQGEVIWDPRTADREGYTDYIGFFVVTPWNNMYIQTMSEDDTDEYVACGLTANSGLVPRETIAQISYDMSIYEVVELIGFAGEDIGSGTVVHVYQLEDGGEVRIGYRLGEGGILRVASVREVAV